MNKDSPTRAILALVAGGLELALWGAVLVLCLLVALFIGGVAWIIGDVFFETAVGVSRYKGKLLSGFRPKLPVEKAKIVHLAHVLHFA